VLQDGPRQKEIGEWLIDGRPGAPQLV